MTVLGSDTEVGVFPEEGPNGRRWERGDIEGTGVSSEPLEIFQNKINK